MLTKTLLIYGFLIFTFVSCQQPDKTADIKNALKTIPSKKKYPQIDTLRINITGAYYQAIPINDSTCKIIWGNKTLSNESYSWLDNFIMSKEKTYLNWSNNKFIALHRSTGSDTWLDIFLPLTKGADAKIFENCLAIDKDNGIIVCEYPKFNTDTILIAENILTGKKQAIGRQLENCSSAFSHYCIDSIHITKNRLFIKWVLPNKIDRPNKTEIKNIKLDI